MYCGTYDATFRSRDRPLWGAVSELPRDRDLTSYVGLIFRVRRECAYPPRSCRGVLSGHHTVTDSHEFGQRAADMATDQSSELAECIVNTALI